MHGTVRSMEGLQPRPHRRCWQRSTTLHLPRGLIHRRSLPRSCSTTIRHRSSTHTAGLRGRQRQSSRGACAAGIRCRHLRTNHAIVTARGADRRATRCQLRGVHILSAAPGSKAPSPFFLNSSDAATDPTTSIEPISTSITSAVTARHCGAAVAA